MDKKHLYKSLNIQSMKNIIKIRDKKLLPIKDNLKFKTKLFNLPKIKSELFTILMKKNNKKRNNFLTSRNISLSDNETYNFHSVIKVFYKFIIIFLLYYIFPQLLFKFVNSRYEIFYIYFWKKKYFFITLYIRNKIINHLFFALFEIQYIIFLNIYLHFIV